MARFDIGYRSPLMERTVQLTVIIPDECTGGDVPLLYLLHGMHGDHTAWTRGTLVERYVRERKIAVVMADAENSYYANQVYGYDYYGFFTKELPEFLHRWFAQLTTDPKKTYVAGLSMGGYGALLLGLSNPQAYAGVASFSGVADLAGHSEDEVSWEGIAVSNWGTDYRKTLPHSRYDLFELVDRLEKAGTPFPRIYLSCGTEDSLLSQNDLFYARMQKVAGADVLYETGPGGHTWTFWDTYLPRALDFFLNIKK